MSTIIEELARWASTLTVDQIPLASRQRALLQHMHVASACRQRAEQFNTRALRAGGSQRGAAVVVGGGTAARRDAVRIHSALAGWRYPVDHLFHASTGTGTVPAAWAHAKGRTIGEVLVATVAANEVGGRLGASMVLGPDDDASGLTVTAACSAICSGLLVGLKHDRLAHAIALSIAMARRTPAVIRDGSGEFGSLLVSQSATQALEAVSMAKAGMDGPLHLLDGGKDLLDELSWIPLRNAFSGLGEAWLTETLSYAFTPVAWPIRVPVESIQEILARHLKAAGRRLRPDQVERIEIHTNLPGYLFAQRPLLGTGLDFGKVCQSGSLAIATLIVGHGLGAEQQSADWLAQEEDRIRDLAERVEWNHSWDCSRALMDHWVSSVSPLFAGLTRAEMRSLFERVIDGPNQVDCGGFGHRLRVLQARPDRWWKVLAYSSGNLADVNWADWQPKSPVQVRLFTTRGGSWPEKRAVPEGAPGHSWTDTMHRIREGFSVGNSQLESRVDELLNPDLNSGADDWTAALLN